MDTKVEVNTKFSVETGDIEQEVTDFTGTIARHVMNVRDAQIRDALIEMGWSPPEEIEECKKSSNAMRKELSKLLYMCLHRPDEITPDCKQVVDADKVFHSTIYHYPKEFEERYR